MNWRGFQRKWLRTNQVPVPAYQKYQNNFKIWEIVFVQLVAFMLQLGVAELSEDVLLQDDEEEEEDGEDRSWRR
jgi:hypothetical protein